MGQCYLVAASAPTIRQSVLQPMSTWATSSTADGGNKYAGWLPVNFDLAETQHASKCAFAKSSCATERIIVHLSPTLMDQYFSLSDVMLPTGKAPRQECKLPESLH